MKKTTFFILTFLVYAGKLSAAEDLCELLDLVNCDHIHKMTARSSAKSLPSTGSATQFNPANVSHERGFGIETFYQAGNPLNFSIVTGTGKVGAALVNSKIENSFFGNRTAELDENYLIRRKKKTQYESDKYSFALGGALFKNKKFGLDLGLMAKYHKEIKKVNPGIGAALRVGFLSIGGALYKDDYLLKFNTENYTETYDVQSLFAGVQLKNVFFDYGQIRTNYDYDGEDVIVDIYSSSFIFDKFLLNLAYRHEKSPFPDYRDSELSHIEIKEDYYTALQYSLNKFIVLGVHYNYYLLDELALSFTVFI